MRFTSLRSNLKMNLKMKQVWKVILSFLQGRPFLDDLFTSAAYRSVKVEIDTPQQMTLEQTFNLFRPFGRIHSINFSDSKTEKFALVTYGSRRSAVSAKNCLHQAFVHDDRPTLNADRVTKDGYHSITVRPEAILKNHAIWSWIAGHPRVMVFSFCFTSLGSS